MFSPAAGVLSMNPLFQARASRYRVVRVLCELILPRREFTERRRLVTSGEGALRGDAQDSHTGGSSARLLQPTATGSTSEVSMALRFVGKDPESGDHGSPAVWVDEDAKDLLFQGVKVDRQTEATCNRDVAMPSYEGIVRVPKRMIPLLREALDVAELE
jgi:hypothetical protein